MIKYHDAMRMFDSPIDGLERFYLLVDRLHM